MRISHANLAKHINSLSKELNGKTLFSPVLLNNETLLFPLLENFNKSLVISLNNVNPLIYTIEVNKYYSSLMNPFLGKFRKDL